MSEFRNNLLRHKTMAELQYVVTLYSDVDLYDEYKVEPSNITNVHWRMYYMLLGQMVEQKGLTVIDEMNMTLHMEGQKDKLQKLYENAGGWNTIQEGKEILELENIESYYREVLRYAAILKLHDSGFDIESKWDDYSKLTYDELGDVVSGTVDSIFSDIGMGEDTVKDIKDGVWNMVEEAHKGVNRGLPVTSKALNSVINGQVLGNITMVGGMSGMGKAQPVDTVIPTPKGYREMGDLEVGDYVFDRRGNPTKVIGVFPQGELDAYEVTLSDGRKTICNDEHLWTVRTSKSKFKTRTLREMIDIGIKTPNGKGNRWRIHSHSAVEYDERDLPVPPYALGALIGDGHLSSPNNAIEISSIDEHVVRRVSEEIGALRYRKSASDNHSWTFHGEPVDIKYAGGMYGQTITKTRERIRSKDVFEDIPEMMTTSRYKYIPREYLESSIEQRRELLHGLMDTDGHIADDGVRFGASYSTASKQLAIDFEELCMSLGYRAKASSFDRGDKGVEHRVAINIPNEKKVELFSLPRKLEIAKRASLKKRRRNYDWEIISSVEKLDKKQDMLCIMVDNEEHLYLTNDFIVTHNTFTTIHQTLPNAIKEKEPLLIMCNEEDIDKWQREILTWVINNVLGGDFVKSRFYQGAFTKDEMQMLRDATDWVNENLGDELIQFVNFNQFSMDKSIRLIRKYATQYDIKYFIIDTLKLDNDIGSEVSDNSWLQLQQNMVKLYNVIKPTSKNVHVWVTYQLNKSNKTRYLDQSALGMSKNVADVVSTLILIRDVLEPEKGTDASALTVMRANGGQVNLSESKDYMVVFIDKNRQGATNRQVVWRVDKGRNIIKDVGFTKISEDY